MSYILLCILLAGVALIALVVNKDRNEYVSRQWLTDLSLGRKEDLVVKPEPWTGIGWFIPPRAKSREIHGIRRVR